VCDAMCPVAKHVMYLATMYLGGDGAGPECSSTHTRLREPTTAGPLPPRLAPCVECVAALHTS
jgi:hypothetical protein